MIARASRQEPPHWRRDAPERSGPIRNAGGYYRTAGSAAAAGVPLSNANDALVAAVRLAYQVAEKQVDRSARLASRLRDAGDRAVGGRSDRKALDATERLVMKTLISGLAWWEASVADGRCPVKRLASAEYRMLGTMLGLRPDAADSSPAAPGAQQARDAQEERAPPGAARGVTGAYAMQPQIIHQAPVQERRPVFIERWELAHPGPIDKTTLHFHSDDPERGPFTADLYVSGHKRGAELRMRMPPPGTPVRWRAVICDARGAQIGVVELVV